MDGLQERTKHNPRQCSELRSELLFASLCAEHKGICSAVEARLWRNVSVNLHSSIWEVNCTEWWTECKCSHYSVWPVCCAVRTSGLFLVCWGWQLYPRTCARMHVSCCITAAALKSVPALTNTHKAYVACTLNAGVGPGRAMRDRTKPSRLIRRYLFWRIIWYPLSDNRNMLSPNFPNYLQFSP